MHAAMSGSRFGAAAIAAGARVAAELGPEEPGAGGEGVLFSGLGREEPGAGGVAGTDAADASGCYSAEFGGVERALLDVARKVEREFRGRTRAALLEQLRLELPHARLGLGLGLGLALGLANQP